MVLRTSPSRLLSLRRIVLQMHRDLLKVEAQIRYDPSPEPLTRFEIAVLVLEDHRFFHHRGVDVISLARELYRLLTFQRFGGASTIEMQLVRTATGYRQLTVRRKLYEMLLALVIQYRYNKFDILRSYLSCAFFGSGLHGSDQAATQIYGEYPGLLPFDQAAELAAMLVYPKPLFPTPEWWRKVRIRATYGKLRYPRFEKRFQKLPRPDPF